MNNLWNPSEAAAVGKDPLSLRVYTSQLLGRDPSLVLHGGGNTSVKIEEKNLFGETESLLYVKGSGWDLATIRAGGFAPVKMDALLKMAHLENLSDTDMVRVQKSAMTDPGAPAPSVEAILHAIIPSRFVDHTHADAVVAITNTPNGEAAIRKIYGDRVLYIPYVMPGFILARKVFELTRDADWQKYEGMVLLHHGIFSFADDARESYDRMIRLVSQAEDYLRSQNVFDLPVRPASGKEDLKALAQVRREVSKKMGGAAVVHFTQTPEAISYASLDNIRNLATRGPLTPDHILHTRKSPLILSQDASPEKTSASIDDYAKNYQNYFNRHASSGMKCLDPAPRWAVWPGHGILSFGVNAKRAEVVADILRHTVRAQQWAEGMGGWVALPEKDLFDVEYWELEQAKLKQSSAAPALQGKVALVTGAASGIGRACVESLRAQGAAVAALDINPSVVEQFQGADLLGIVCDVTNSRSVDTAVAAVVRKFGGLDILVPNAGLFPSSKNIDALDDETWNKVLDVNLTGAMHLIRAATPYLVLGIDPAIVVVASKNVPAPGPGAAAYSASKAGLTQLARVAALELGPKGVRVNMLHPHAVMDTGIWTPEVLQGRARHYNMTVEDYKRSNLMKVEVKSKDVADLVAALAGPLFLKTTGAQIPVDGGNDRVI